jgi:hypothetical protein
MPELNRQITSATPTGRIISAFNNLLYEDIYYNVDIFPKSLLNSFTTAILSKRSTQFQIVYGNRLLLNYVFPGNVLQSFHGIPNKTTIENFIDYGPQAGDKDKVIKTPPELTINDTEAHRRLIRDMAIKKLLDKVTDKTDRLILKRFFSNHNIKKISEDLSISEHIIKKRITKLVKKHKEIADGLY